MTTIEVPDFLAHLKRDNRGYVVGIDDKGMLKVTTK